MKGHILYGHPLYISLLHAPLNSEGTLYGQKYMDTYPITPICVLHIPHLSAQFAVIITSTLGKTIHSLYSFVQAT